MKLQNMKKQHFYLSLILSTLICRALVYADRGMIIWPPAVHLNQTAQNAIVAWNGQEEIIILSTNIESSSLATALEVLPLPSNPTEIKQADPACFEKLVEIMNEKLEAIRQDYKGRGGGGDVPAGIEITFHEKIGAHDVTVVKVNNLDYFLNWIKDFAQSKGLEVKEISPAFKDGVSNYLKREIDYFVFDVIAPEEGQESIKPLIYRFDSDYLYYPLLISGISEIKESEAEINLFLITSTEAYIFDPPYNYYRYGWFYSYGFPVELNEEELQEVSEVLGDLFEAGCKARKASLYSRLNQVNRDLQMYPSYFWDKDLTLGNSGNKVKTLHKMLINMGFRISDLEISECFFGQDTKNAVAKFQEEYLGWSNGTGYFGPQTQEYFKKLSIKLWGQTIYVDDDATGANDGSSWADAYNYLQDALAAASEGDEIRVAKGIYRPNEGLMAIPEFDWRTTTFQLIDGVTLKGGFAGFGTPDPDARDIERYETILSGDLNGDDTDVNHPTDLLSETTRAENSYHVVTNGSQSYEPAILDGFTITGGNANAYFTGSKSCGGGMYNYSGSLNLTNCIFRSNSAFFGGGMYNSPSSPTLNNCIFIGNTAFLGGGMYNYFDKPTLRNCIFIGNTARVTPEPNSAYGSGYGGGLLNHESSSILISCTFSGNWAEERGGAIENWNYWNTRSPTLTNCILWGNYPEEIYGGAPVITYTNIQGGWPGEGNIDADPCFAEPGYWYPNGTPEDEDEDDDVWIEGDYHLKSQAGRWDASSASWVKDDVTSPCIDAGDPKAPIGHEPFPNGGIINMGAYGGTAEASKSYFGEPVCEKIVAGDINGDCKVDFEDFKLLALHWLERHNP